MTWSVAALAVLSFALFVLTRARQRTRGPEVATPGAPVASGSMPAPPAKASNEPAAEESPIRSCPVCLSEYAAPRRFCMRDGAPLTEGRSSGPFSPGMICPTCRRGYPSDASYCPEDADELVPFGLFGASGATHPPVRIDSTKICPECGVRHSAHHLFCGNDGAELVVVN